MSERLSYVFPLNDNLYHVHGFLVAWWVVSTLDDFCLWVGIEVQGSAYLYTGG